MLEIKLDDFIDSASDWIDSLTQKEKSNNTIRSYRNGINKFVEYLKLNNIDTINKDSVISYKGFLLEDKLSLNTVNQRIISVNRFFRDNHLNDLTVKSEKIQESNLIDTITETDFKRLIRWANNLNMEREKLIMQTLANTGVRVSELEFFTVSNLRKAGRTGVIEVRNKGKTRKVIIPDKLKKDLLDYARKEERQARKDGKKDFRVNVIFHAKNNPDKLLDSSQIWRNLKYIAGKARVKKSIAKPHNFRHLFSKRFLDNNGNNILLLKNLLGHSSLNTTELYTKLSGYEAKLIVNDMYSSGEEPIKKSKRKKN